MADTMMIMHQCDKHGLTPVAMACCRCVGESDTLRSQLSAAESARAKAEAIAFAPLVWSSNGEAGDGQNVCSRCGADADAPHSADVCIANLRAADEQTNSGLAGFVTKAEEERDSALARVATLEEALRVCDTEGERGYTLGWAGARAALMIVRSTARAALEGPPDGT